MKVLQAIRLWLHPHIEVSDEAQKRREAEADARARAGFAFMQEQRRAFDKRPDARFDVRAIHEDLDQQDRLMREAIDGKR